MNCIVLFKFEFLLNCIGIVLVYVFKDQLPIQTQVSINTKTQTAFSSLQYIVATIQVFHLFLVQKVSTVSVLAITMATQLVTLGVGNDSQVLFCSMLLFILVSDEI